MLTDDQIRIADLILSRMTLQQPIYLQNFYSSIGELISKTYSGEAHTVYRICQVANQTHISDLIEFLLRNRYIERTQNQGQFVITESGVLVNERGGHKSHRLLEDEKKRQDEEAAQPPKIPGWRKTLNFLGSKEALLVYLGVALTTIVLIFLGVLKVPH
jgi:hypothetical protein